MKRVYIITGANGHLGNTIIRKLSSEKVEMRALVLPHEVTKKLVELGCTVFFGNVCNKDDIDTLFAGTEKAEVIVIHCAGIISIATKVSKLVYDVNVNGTKNVVDKCLANNVKRLIHVSSVHAIPELKKGQTIVEVDKFDPDLVKGEYAKTKSIATQYVLDKTKEGLNAVVVHPSGIVGPYDYGRGHLTQLIQDYFSKKLTALVDGGYDFADVRDVANGIIAAIEKGRSGECYILANKYISVRDLMAIVATYSPRKPITTILPIWFAKLTAPLAELYYKIRKKTPLYTSYSLYTLLSNSVFSYEKAAKELGYVPRDMHDTVKDTIAWMRENKRLD